MNDFEKWFTEQDFYTNMRFIHGDGLFAKDGDVYRVLPVHMTYQAWQTARYKSKDDHCVLTQEWHSKGWDARQDEVDGLKSQLNNMEQCYIEKKKQVEELQSPKRETKWTTIKVKCLKCGHYLSGCHCNHFGDQCPHLNTSKFGDNGLAECFNCNKVINKDREVVGDANDINLTR